MRTPKRDSDTRRRSPRLLSLSEAAGELTLATGRPITTAWVYQSIRRLGIPTRPLTVFVNRTVPALTVEDMERLKRVAAQEIS
jgi:hypothetical protein